MQATIFLLSSKVNNFGGLGCHHLFWFSFSEPVKIVGLLPGLNFFLCKRGCILESTISEGDIVSFE